MQLGGPAVPARSVEDRLDVHELIRLGVGRQEDLQLLQTVRQWGCDMSPVPVHR
jgi:hypothetical protein